MVLSTHSTLLHTLHYCTLNTPAHSTILHTLHFCTLNTPAHSTLLHTLHSCTLYTIAHSTPVGLLACTNAIIYLALVSIKGTLRPWLGILTFRYQRARETFMILLFFFKSNWASPYVNLRKVSVRLHIQHSQNCFVRV